MKKIFATPEYKRILNTTMEGYWLTDADGKLLDVNQAYINMSGYSRKELLAISIADLEAKENFEEVKRHIDKAMTLGHDRFATIHKSKDGREYPVEISTTLWSEKKQFIVFVRDISHYDETLQTLELAMQTTKLAVISYDVISGKIWRSDNHDEIYGYKENLAEWDLPIMLSHIDLNDKLRVQKYITDCTNNLEVNLRFKIKRTDNALIRIVELKGKRYFNKNGETQKVICTLQDITEQIQFQQSALQTSKMGALGDMAGNIAHEINNPLTVIFTRIKKLLVDAKSNSLDLKKITGDFEKIYIMTLRIEKIVRVLKYFSQDGDSESKTPIQIEQVIQDCLDLCKERIQNNKIKLRLQYSANPYVLGNAIEFSHVIMNLINNSFDAVQAVDDKWIDIDVSLQNSIVHIRVSDSGEKIPEEIQTRIMEPFFTTKEIGKGTGVGLSTAKGIIEQHQGKLYLDTAAINTCFVIELPENQ